MSGKGGVGITHVSSWSSVTAETGASAIIKLANSIADRNQKRKKRKQRGARRTGLSLELTDWHKKGSNFRV